jgi:hypothetical protein
MTEKYKHDELFARWIAEWDNIDWLALKVEFDEIRANQKQESEDQAIAQQRLESGMNFDFGNLNKSNT